MSIRTRSAGLLMLTFVLGCKPQPAAAPVADDRPKPQSLPTIKIDLNQMPLVLQVADDDQERELGLMYTHQMPADHGMIFVFPVERPLSFWMANTPIDLDIVFVDSAKKVVSVKTMHAYDKTDVPSDGASRYAIELNAGIAAKARVSVGQVLDIPADLADKAR